MASGWPAVTCGEVEVREREPQGGDYGNHGNYSNHVQRRRRQRTTACMARRRAYHRALSTRHDELRPTPDHTPGRVQPNDVGRGAAEYESPESPLNPSTEPYHHQSTNRDCHRDCHRDLDTSASASASADILSQRQWRQWRQWERRWERQWRQWERWDGDAAPRRSVAE